MPKVAPRARRHTGPPVTVYRRVLFSLHKHTRTHACASTHTHTRAHSNASHAVGRCSQCPRACVSRRTSARCPRGCTDGGERVCAPSIQFVSRRARSNLIRLSGGIVVSLLSSSPPSPPGLGCAQVPPNAVRASVRVHYELTEITRMARMRVCVCMRTHRSNSSRQIARSRARK